MTPNATIDWPKIKDILAKMWMWIKEEELPELFSIVGDGALGVYKNVNVRCFVRFFFFWIHVQVQARTSHEIIIALETVHNEAHMYFRAWFLQQSIVFAVCSDCVDLVKRISTVSLKTNSPQSSSNSFQMTQKNECMCVWQYLGRTRTILNVFVGNVDNLAGHLNIRIHSLIYV